MFKPKVCSNCGGRIDLATYKCEYCGTQFYRDNEDDLAEYGYDNNFHPQWQDGTYATVAARIDISESELKQFESDARYRNALAERLASQLAPALVRYLYVTNADSFDLDKGMIKNLTSYLKVKRYSAPRDEDILNLFT